MLDSFRSDWSIRTRVYGMLAVVTVLSLGTMAAVSYRLGVRTLEAEATARITAVRELKARQIEAYFQTIRDQLVTMSEDRMVIDALREFSSSASTVADEIGMSQVDRESREQRLRLHYQDEFVPRLQAGTNAAGPLSAYWPQDDVAVALQHLFISENPFDVGSKLLLDASDAGTRYDAVHERYHPLLRRFLERFGYHDVFLIRADDQRVVYSVLKEVDFGTSLVAGPHRESNLARAVEVALGFSVATEAHLVDFEPYLPSYGAADSFIASPVYDGDELLGALVFQMPLSRINETMTNGGQWRSAGFGETGEAYLVGPDERLRTESRFLMEEQEEYLLAIREAGVDEALVRAIEAQGSAVGLQRVESDGVRRALEGESGVSRIRDYRGVEVFSSFRPLAIRDLDWVLLSEIDVAEAMAPVGSLARRGVGALAVLLPILGLLAFWFSRNLVRPIQALSSTATALAAGELDHPVDVDRGDEVGDLARSFESMRRSLQELIERQNRSIEALSTPLIPIDDDVVVLPLVGELDAVRSQHLRESLTQHLHAKGARCVIIDLTGVSALDPDVAQDLARVAQSARLMGATTIISGMRPQLAAELSDHPDAMAGVATARSLRDAVDLATEGGE